jgi:tartrate dehydratase beta subunit/fumarate hydratase class I family protein
LRRSRTFLTLPSKSSRSWSSGPVVVAAAAALEEEEEEKEEEEEEAALDAGGGWRIVAWASTTVTMVNTSWASAGPTRAARFIASSEDVWRTVSSHRDIGGRRTVRGEACRQWALFDWSG